MSTSPYTAESLYPIFRQYGRVTTDTRRITKGDIFFALRGPAFNGNDFVMQALDTGCSYAVADEDRFNDPRILLVDDVLNALQKLATIHRNHSRAEILAITGSNGKTTTKELMHRVLSEKYKTLATEGNLNNHIGVPLTLLRLKDEHEKAIIEMGANHQGEIRELCEISLPVKGLITNIGKAHLEGFGGTEGVKKGKGELFDHLRKHHGFAFVHADSETLMDMSAGLKRLTYGQGSEAEIRGALSGEVPFLKVRWQAEGKQLEINTQLTGIYNFPNIMAAVAAGLDSGIPPEAITRAIEGYRPDNSRSQIIEGDGLTIILDAYNANPTSMEAALRNLAAMPGNQKVAFLGDMLELGQDTVAEHEKIESLLSELRIDEAFLVGPAFVQVARNYPAFENVSQCAEAVNGNKFTGKVILIKGSRGIGMEKLLSLVQGKPATR